MLLVPGPHPSGLVTSVCSRTNTGCQYLHLFTQDSLKPWKTAIPAPSRSKVPGNSHRQPRDQPKPTATCSCYIKAQLAHSAVKVCALYHLPECPRGVRIQSPITVAGLIVFPPLPFTFSASSPLPAPVSYACQANCLHTSPRLVSGPACGGTQTKTTRNRLISLCKEIVKEVMILSFTTAPTHALMLFAQNQEQTWQEPGMWNQESDTDLQKKNKYGGKI